MKIEPGNVSNEFYVYGNERVAMIVPNTLGTTPSRIQYNEATFFLADHLGNTRVAYMSTATAGSSYIINALDYYPYGKVLREYDNGAGDKYLTTQHERDQETGLDYRGARYYDSDVARFLSIDPWADQYPSWSTYNYVLGNPIMFIDPTGNGPTDWVKKPDGSIEWDPNAISPETTQPGDKYVGKSGKGTDDEGNMVTYNPDGTKTVTQSEGEAVVIGVRGKTNPNSDLVRLRSDYVKVTFAPGADNPVSPKLLKYFNKVMKSAKEQGITSVYVSSTTNHPSNANKSAHSLKNGARAVDIARINGVAVSPNCSGAKILQRIIKQTSGWRENYGPFIIEKMNNGKPIPAPWAREIKGGHYDHVHISVPQ